MTDTSTKTRSVNNASESNEYPKHFTWTTAGGMRCEWGNEEGKQFLRVKMPSGAQMEIYPDGTTEYRSPGETKHYNKAGLTVSVDKNFDFNVKGHGVINISGGSTVVCAGDAQIYSGGDVLLQSGGNLNMSVKNCFLGVRGDLGISVEGSTALVTAGKTNIESGGAVDIIGSGGINQDGATIKLNSGASSSVGTKASTPGTGGISA